MSYVDGFVIPVPTANKQAYIDMAKTMGALFVDYGAIRLVECWADDVPHGKQTDFFMAVKAKEDESVVFAWVEWPDKATRDAGMARLHEVMQNDERSDPTKNPPPFDGARMIFGGFTPVLTLEK